jgi:membrane protein
VSTRKVKTILCRTSALIAAAARKWLDDRAPSMGAALAYYTAFSLAPLLVIVIAVAGLAVGHEGAQMAIVAQMRDLLGDAGGDAIAGMLAQTSDLGHGVFALGVGIVALLLGATTAFAELEDDLDRIWHAEPRSANGLINMLRGRLLSFGMVLCVGFLLTVSLVVNAAISSLGQHMFGSTEAILQFLNLAASIAVTTILFAAIYKILPNVRIAWSDVWVGALVTSVLFAVGRWLIGLYIGKSAVAATFGSAGPFVALMVWIYYSTQIFLLGAEFTYVVARARERVVPGVADPGPRKARRPFTPDSQAHAPQRLA